MNENLVAQAALCRVLSRASSFQKMRRNIVPLSTSDKQQKELEPNTEVWDGEIFAYWEQGMEGRIEFAFQPANSNKPILLENEQYLTIYGENGEVIWSGYINLVRLRFWDRHNLQAPIWSYNKQKGVPYKQWMEWFWRKPSLKARLEKGRP